MSNKECDVSKTRAPTPPTIPRAETADVSKTRAPTLNKAESPPPPSPSSLSLSSLAWLSPTLVGAPLQVVVPVRGVFFCGSAPFSVAMVEFRVSGRIHGQRKTLSCPTSEMQYLQCCEGRVQGGWQDSGWAAEFRVRPSFEQCRGSTPFTGVTKCAATPARERTDLEGCQRVIYPLRGMTTGNRSA